ncbi:MAG: ABC transporter ATP-binding protein [Flavobacteriales bacterium]
MTVLKVEDISKQYRLGEVGTGTLSHDLNRWWAGVRGKEDPYLKVGDKNDRTTKSESDYVWVLQNISFEVQQGEVLGIIGKNGAGKSTLLKVLSQITAPTTGDIKVKGRIAALLEVGTGMHPELTGRENIYLNGSILGMTRREITRKLDEIIDFSGCAKYVDTPVKRYSSGMMVRLGFAVASFLEPEILIVDEVLAVGDAEFQEKAIGRMQDVSTKEGRTVLFVSHNLLSVRNLCTRGLVLDKGNVAFRGSADEAVDFYRGSIFENIEKTDLTERNEARTHPDFMVRKIWFESDAGESGNHFMSGDKVSVCIEYESKDPDLKYLSVGLGLYDFQGVMVSDLWNVSAEGYRDAYPSKGVMRCTFPRLPLNEGKYSLNIYMTLKNTVAFALSNAASFNVTQGDFYRTGIIPQVGKGKVFLEQQWTFN